MWTRLRGTLLFLPRSVQQQVRRHSSEARGGKKFIDLVYMSAQGGRGGDGCASFKQERGSRRKFPDGGHGGPGGNVVFVAGSSKHSLNFESMHVAGGSGGNGKSDKMNGRMGSDVKITVPIGTVISEVTDIHEEYDEATEAFSKVRDTRLCVDMTQEGMSFVAAKGGRGGEGNCRFKTGDTRAPRYSTVGTRGTKKSYQLQLKTLADVGLVGYPNAGKSSFLSEISRATPKIAAYPFTTLKPSVGIVELTGPNLRTFSVADIPGLVDGAHENRGLGHEFLGHIERTQVLLFLVDIAGTEQRDPLDDLAALRKELYLYDPALLQRPSIVFANKCDRKPQTSKKNWERLFSLPGLPQDIEIILGSCKTGEGVADVVQAIAARLKAE